MGRELVDVYYGDRSGERTHRLSPALCKRAREAQDVVWVTGGGVFGEEGATGEEEGAAAAASADGVRAVRGDAGGPLRGSISDVRTAVAIPVCHDESRTNVTLIFFSVRR